MFNPNAHKLREMDPDVAAIINSELKRQQAGVELIASENYCSPAVMEAQGSVLTNKYAEGYPHKRYYDGCEFVDKVEELAIARVKKLFGVKYANVQPHSGSQANFAVFLALLNGGDKVLGMDLSQGGHLTHGSPVNFSGKLFEAVHYGIDEEKEIIDYDIVRNVALKEKPKMIIAGASAYPRMIDFKKFREIADEVGAYLLVDMAHFAGLVAAGLHPSPVGHAHVITSTTHKTLRGPRGGIILTDDEALAKKMNSAVFPGSQGGPLEHVIAAKAVAFNEALQADFIDYQKQVITNAKVLGEVLQSHGVDIVSGGTDNHLILMKTDSVNMSGKEASTLLESVGITCNKNMVPKDSRSPFVTSGVRMGTPAVTTRGFLEQDCQKLAELIVSTLKSAGDTEKLNQVRDEVQRLCQKYPIYS